MDIKYLLKDLLYTLSHGGSVQDFINNRFKSPTQKIIDPKFVSYCITQNNILLPLSQCNEVLTQVLTDYDFSDIRDSDIVLDIGANTGIFSLTAGKKAKHVYAVEPLYTEELKQNLKNNNSINITPLKCALSNVPEVEIEFGEKRGIVSGKTLSEITSLCGGHIDFLKCDCEGGEWIIKPEELQRIRRVEMEVHSYKGERLFDYVDMLKSLGFVVKTDSVLNRKDLLLIHAFRT